MKDPKRAFVIFANFFQIFTEKLEMDAGTQIMTSSL